MRVRNLVGVVAAVVLWLGAIGDVCAVSLGKIDTASHLDEAFFAEVPFTLKQGEDAAKLSVSLAGSADYKILEVYRDIVVDDLSTEIVSDSRGDRIAIRSKDSIRAPFFNLVLKVRHGRVTQFKKYPVFLDLPKLEVRMPEPMAAPVAKPATAPVSIPFGDLEDVEQAVVSSLAPEQPQVVEVIVEKEFKPYENWARIQRYGPMVYGDTLGVVAQRLQTDDRYTLQQVMTALFEKNSEKFTENNMNMINAGTHLDVPTAKEVESNTSEQARAKVRKHAKQWRELKKQPRYAALSEAQKQRYSKRVRVGKKATGEPSAMGASGSEMGADTSQTRMGADKAGSLASLRQQNEKLAQQLQESEETISKLKGAEADADLTAATERIKKLELRLARMQTELNQARSQATESSNEMMNWITYGLAGLVILLLAALGFLMRRERPHPSTAPEPVAEEPGLMRESPMLSDEESEPVGEEVQEEAKAFEQPAEEVAEAATASSDILTGQDEEPDVDTDYLAEADVYLRYGMDDEAIQQVRMAIRQREGNVDAHCKLVQVLHTQGDKKGLEQAISTGAAALAGDELTRFEEAVSSLDIEDEEAAEIQMLPTNEYSSDENQESPAEAGLEEESSLDAVQEEEATVSDLPLEDESLELGGLEWSPDAEEAGEIEVAAAAEEDAEELEDASPEDMGGLDFSLSDDDLGVPGDQAEASEVEEALVSDDEAEMEGLSLAAEGGAEEETAAPEEPAAEDEPGLSSEEERALPEGEGEEAPSEDLLAEAVDAQGEEPNPNTDYLAEADTYLRYGMDDEAIQQVRMAIRQREGNVDAHCKLVQVLHTQGDKKGLEQAISTGAAALAGDELTRFEEAVSSLDIEDEEAAEIQMLPTNEYSSDENQESPAEAGLEEESSLDAVQEEEATVSDLPLEDESLELGGLEWSPDAEEAGEIEVAAAAEEDAEELEDASPEDMGGLDFSLSDDDLGVPGDQAEASEVEEALVSDDEAEMEGLSLAAEGGAEEETAAPEEPAAEDEPGLSSEEERALPEGEAVEEIATSTDDSETDSEGDEIVLDLDVSDTFDVSKELDGLLSDLNAEEPLPDQTGVDLSSASLNVDMGRSQLAQGNLEAAEQSFTTSLDSGDSGEALLGLADIALQRGENESGEELLAKAEALLNDETRPWFDELRGKLSE